MLTISISIKLPNEISVVNQFTSYNIPLVIFLGKRMNCLTTKYQVRKRKLLLRLATLAHGKTNIAKSLHCIIVQK